MRTVLRLAVAVSVGTASALVLSPAGATASQASFLRETGCRDVVGGSAYYERDRVVDGLPVADRDYPGALERDSGRLRAVLHLAASVCADVELLLTAFRPDGSVLLHHALAGTQGQASVEADLDVTDHADDCLAVQFTTKARDVVVDLAPDALHTFDTVCDRESGDVVYR